jgi:hypothetical protein
MKMLPRHLVALALSRIRHSVVRHSIVRHSFVRHSVAAPPRSSETVKMTMLVRVFDNPRVHSNIGYHVIEKSGRRMCGKCAPGAVPRSFL